MTNFDLSKPPYYGRVLDEDYTQLLFLPGMHLQNAEFNEVQANYKRQLKGVADCFLSDGDIRSGAQILVNDNNSVTVTNGSIYVEGLVRSFKEQNIQITGIGEEIIGVKLVKSAIDYNTDKELLSPAAGYPNYAMPGAERLKETLVLTVNDPNAVILYVLTDGKLSNAKKVEDDTFYKRLLELLAERTYDESGHYTVEGLELSQKNQYSPDKLFVSMARGKAYVEGWSVKKNTASTIAIDRALDTRSINAEPKIYKTGTNKYRLNGFPVARINRVTALVSVSTTMTRQGAVNGLDPIPGQYTPVVRITSITATGGGTTYKENVDYTLESDSVRWITGGDQPALGATYNITFQYNRTMTKDVDYKLTIESDAHYLQLLQSNTPVDNSQMSIDYDSYLYYINTIAMDKDGNLHVIKGQPDTIDKVAPPDIADNRTLLIGFVRVTPMNDNLHIVNTMNRRSEMSRIQRMYERLEESELNQAISDLDKEAMDMEEATLLRGILTDGFIGWTKADINHPEFSAAIDPIERTLTCGYDEVVNKLTLDNTKTTGAAVFDKLVTVQGSERIKDQQPYGTEAHLINPYTAFPENPSVKLTPSADNWTDSNMITIQREGETIRKNTSRSSLAGTTISTSSTVDVLETAIEYMRSITVTIHAKKFRPSQRYIRATFNDIPVVLSPSESKYADTSGTLKADEKGEVRGSFTIPSGVRTGTVDVKVFCDDYPSLIGNAPFTANGVLNTTVTTVTTTKTIVTRIDPLAQTFEFTEDQILTSVGLYFANIQAGYPVTVQIRESINGYPSNTVIAEKVLRAEEIAVSPNSAVETKVTFDNPIHCKANTQYSFSVLTVSNQSSMYIQDLGKVDLISNQIVARNPYINGVMFSSSNALTWTAHQTQNIKFNLYTNTYRSSAEIYFYQLNGIDYDNIMLLADTSVPLGCSLTWEYSLDGERGWMPLAINRNIPLQNKLESATVRAVMTTEGKLTPSIALDSLIFVGSKNKSTSNYVSRNVRTDVGFTTVKIVADVDTPTGTGVVFYYATDINGTNWKTLTQQGEGKSKVDGSFKEFTYTATEGTAVQNFRVKVALTTNNSTVIPRVKALKCIMK